MSLEAPCGFDRDHSCGPSIGAGQRTETRSHIRAIWHLDEFVAQNARAVRRWLLLIPRPHPARHALQSTASDRSHTVGFNCRLTCGGSTFGIEPVPPRNTSSRASETECSPGRLALRLASGVTRANVVAV